jgi:hypothetical protein
MNISNAEQASPAHTLHSHPPEVRVNDELIRLNDRTPTGSQVLAAAGLRPDVEFALLLWPPVGPTREIALEEVTPAPHDGPLLEFLAVRSDHVAYFLLDDERYAWAGPLTEEAIRRFGRVPANKEIWLERRAVPDLLLEPGQAIDLDPVGVERLYSKAKTWRLDVQGEPTEWDHPDVVVREALIKAGIDMTKTWTIILKRKGQPNLPVELSTILNLDEPGIERLWLRPRQIDNGDGASERREFSLLPKDQRFLDTLSYRWEAIMDGNRRWLVIHSYALPTGYNVDTCKLAFEIPGDYPSAQIDMFYCDPPLSLHNGNAPPNTDVRQDIAGVSFQRWSRHRNAANQWSPQHDNVSTHLGLVDEAMGREVGA